MKIEFDPDKAAVNPLNHEGVTFDEAQPVLLDPYALTREDADSVGEVRFVTLGMGGKGRILIVVWTLRGDCPRIISAWKANQPHGHAELLSPTNELVMPVPLSSILSRKRERRQANRFASFTL
jgi:uncharacterized DUF497 family protein